MDKFKPITKYFFQMPSEYFEDKQVLLLKDIENKKGHKILKDESARILCKAYEKQHGFDIISLKGIIILSVPTDYLLIKNK